MDRRSYIGSSDIAAVLGISPWKTPVDLYFEKIAEDTPLDNDTAILRRGRRLEPVILEILQEDFDFWVVDRNRRIVHPEFSFLAAEQDFVYSAIVSPDGGRMDAHGEIKSVGFNRAGWGESGSQEVPSYYIAQAMYASAIAQAPELTVAASFSFDDTRTYRFDYDAVLGDALIEKARSFWVDHVLAKVPPAAITADDTKTLLKRYGSFDWQASEQALRIAGEATALRRSIKLLEAEQDAKDKALLDCLYSAAQVHGVEGEEFKKAQILGADGKPVATLSEISRKGYEVKATTFTTLRFAKEKA